MPDDGSGRFQCRECGEVRQIGRFVGESDRLATIKTACERCDGTRRFDALAADAESVMHRWLVVFADLNRVPYRIDLTAPSRREVRTQVASEYPAHTIEVLLHEERL